MHVTSDGEMKHTAVLFEASRDMLLAEMSRYRSKNSAAAAEEGVALEAHLQDWTPLLSPAEQARLERFIEFWKQKRGTDPVSDPRAVFSLANEPTQRFTATGSKGTLPCCTSSSSDRL